MKIGSKNIIDAIVALNPAHTKLVRHLTLLMNGRRFTADLVGTTQTMVWARDHIDHEKWLNVVREEIVGFEAQINPEECSRAKISITLPDVLDYLLRR